MSDSDGTKAWTIKSVPLDARHAATAAAEAVRMNMGEWIARAIRTQIQQDRNSTGLPSVITAPSGTAAPSPASALTTPATAAEALAEIEALVQSARTFAEITSEAPPKRVTLAIYRLITSRLGELTPAANRRDDPAKAPDATPPAEPE